MNKPKTPIVVLGSNGMLGYGISRYFKYKNIPFIPLTRSNFDVLQHDITAIASYIEGSRAVINCIGTIKPRITLQTSEETLIINTLFPKNLAKVCSYLNVKCFHITTDCVYSGLKGNYTENDPFDCQDLYGLSKLGGETSDCMTLRTSIIGEEVAYKYSLLEWAISQQGKTIKGFTNHVWNGVTTVYAGEIIEAILRTGYYHPGIFHIYSPLPVSKYELLVLINEIYNLNLNIIPQESDTACDRSLSSIYPLSTDIARKSLEQQVTEMYKLFRENEQSHEVIFP